MNTNLVPFNIELLQLKPSDIKNIGRIKVLDIYDGSSKNFHPDGLFSTELFGRVGEERRNRFYGYIDLHISVLHPVMFRVITDLKQMYKDILSNKVKVIFDPDKKDFVISESIEAKSGFNYFLKYLPELKLHENDSTRRIFNVKLFDKYKDKCLIDKLLVMPPGLRDYEVDENGKPSEDEINALYRKVLSLSNLIENINLDLNSEYLDNNRFNLQLAVNEIYDYLKAMMEGKHGLLLGKWASRKIFDSTRNVATSFIPDAESMDSDNIPTANQTVVNLYQFLRATMPLSINKIRSGFLSEVFSGPNNPAYLVDKKTLKASYVSVDGKYYDKWMSLTGLEKTLSMYGQENLRHKYLEIENYYIGLIYKGSDGTYKLFHDIDDLPADRNKKEVYPVTFCELVYLSIYKGSSEIPALITRYPVAGYGGIYPSYVYVKTTNKSEQRYELDFNWEKTDFKVKEFPITNGSFYNSISVDMVHNSRLGLDFDGDMISFTCLMTEDSKEEVSNLLNDKSYYLDLHGGLSFTSKDYLEDNIAACMTG